jgi:D-threo-aldose 1-dehydrogenase
MLKSRNIRGVHLTPLGLGGAQLGNLYRAIDDQQAMDLVDAAWEAGIRYFDTAPHYGLGLSERRLGRALAKRPRDEFVVSTKVGRLLVPDPTGADRLDDEGFKVPAVFRRHWDFSADGVQRSLEESLERLGLDHVDIVFAHDPDDHLEQTLSEGIPALIELREQGLIRAVGAGMNRTAPLTRIVSETDVDVIMCAGRYTLLEQDALVDLFPTARQREVAVVAAGIFNSGLLSVPVPDAAATYDYAAVPPPLLKRARMIADVCGAHGVTLPQAALAFPLLNPTVVSAVVGMADAHQVAVNTADARVKVPAALWVDLRERGLLTVDETATRS